MPDEDAQPYDRSGVSCGIAHIGVGGFHRAHQAAAIDDLLRQGLARDWGICGIGVLPSDSRMRDALAAQDHRYTLVVKHPDGVWDARTIGAIVDFLHAPDDPEAAVERLASPSIRIVSLTITEGGYNIDQVTGAFDSEAPAVLADLDSDAPSTVFGLVVEALRRRRERGIAPFTVMSCDNIQGNGEVARAAFAGFAGLRDPELAAWIARSVSFPSSMVDRITPATTDADRSAIEQRFGIVDRWPVVTEPFFQWVLEDGFPAGRPPLERAGVQLVSDVEPYELMKLRLLNASHQGLCYFGPLSGYTSVHDAAMDENIARFLRRYMDEEATPTLHPVPGVDLDAYKHTLIERFANPEVQDTIARLCAESSDRIPKWLLPVVRERRASGHRTPLSAAIVASWARYAEGVDETGAPIDVVDNRRELVMANAARQHDEPTAFLTEPSLFGDLVNDAGFVDDYLAALASLHTVGARATVARFA
ncbi:mannitol dehydrogenase family protein [Leifsonia lichenia]